MDFVQIIKSEHARVNDMLDKLGDTSDGAMKTRERLTGQIATALDEHSRKEEAYLYPALRRHRDASKEVDEFLAGASDAHNQINILATELDGMAKDDEGLLAKAKELKRVANQHMREEEHLLPAVRKAMDEAEIRALDEALTTSAEDLPERVVEGAAAALRHGAETATEGARRVTQRVAEQAERGSRTMLAAAEIYSETAQLTTEDLQAIATCSTVAAGGLTEIRHAWMDWFGRSLRTSARASQDLFRCTTIEQLADVQRNFLTESLNNLLEGSAQMLRISGRISEDARRPIEDRVTSMRRGGDNGERGRARQRA
ncbi:MAG TPA: hemerythrin domain-containing protein [Stellaceae bacterium]